MDEWDWGRLRIDALREARRYMRSRADVEEVAQEALARAWRGRARCMQADAPGPWLRQIVRNEALRALAQPRRAAEVLGELEESMADSHEDVHALTATRIDVRRALSGLPGDDVEILTLRYAADLTQPQVAQLLGVPEGTAKVRLHRARLRLKSALEEP
jgi:RNA polymerase sigma-70 factor (ECF subfamily)